jgi:hypothetical protein
MMQRITSLVKKEIPKRLLFTIFFPAWKSRSYRSLLSNQDLMDVRKMSKKSKTTRKDARETSQLDFPAVIQPFIR